MTGRMDRLIAPAHEGRARQRATDGGRTRRPSKPDDHADSGSPHAFQSTFGLLVARGDDARTHAQLAALRALLSSGPAPQRR